MVLDSFLQKFIGPREREVARRDLTEVMALLDDSAKVQLGRTEGYRQALEDARAAARNDPSATLRWLDDQLNQVSRQP